MRESRDLRFDGRVAVVTGAGRGLGRAHALLLAHRGASVVCADLEAGGTGDDIRAAGGTALSVVADIATPAGAAAIVARALSAFGRIDVLVNNAGILRSAAVAETEDSIWDVVTGVNLRGSFLMTRAAWPAMAARGYGRVVFTASNSGLLGIPGSSAYGASKAALWGLTRVLAIEGAPVGISVNAIAPVAFTDMSRQSRAAPSSWRSGAGDAWSERLAPERVSPVVAWLAHADCTLSGEVLSTGGGRVARFFLGLTPGIVEEELTPEAVRDRESEILVEDGYEVLADAGSENRRLYRRLMG